MSDHWTRQQLLVAVNVYHKLPFGQFDARNRVIQDVAKRIDRTASALAMKLSNLASLDPEQKARGRNGLPKTSKFDRKFWAEFQAAPESMLIESEEAFRKLYRAREGDEVELVKGKGVEVRKVRTPTPPKGATEAKATVTVRRGQQFFRQMILNAFDNRCGVTGIHVRELLVASHIMPWAGFPEGRLELGNGLCLSKLHDAAFDQGLITFDEEFRMVLSRELRDYLPQPSLKQNFVDFAGTQLVIAGKGMGPNTEYLRRHREKIFRG